MEVGFGSPGKSDCPSPVVVDKGVFVPLDLAVRKCGQPERKSDIIEEGLSHRTPFSDFYENLHEREAA